MFVDVFTEKRRDHEGENESAASELIKKIGKEVMMVKAVATMEGGECPWPLVWVTQSRLLTFPPPPVEGEPPIRARARVHRATPLAAACDLLILKNSRAFCSFSRSAEILPPPRVSGAGASAGAWCGVALNLTVVRVLSLPLASCSVWCALRSRCGVIMVLYEYEVHPHARYYECHVVDEPRTPIIVDHSSMMHREPDLNIGIVNIYSSVVG